ncbi:hypothetical protein BDR03DRAFT_975507, partial [Suillus americanus]
MGGHLAAQIPLLLFLPTVFAAIPSVLEAPTSTHLFAYDAGRVGSFPPPNTSSFWSATLSGRCMACLASQAIVFPHWRDDWTVKVMGRWSSDSFLRVCWSTLDPGYLSLLAFHAAAFRVC